MKNTGRFLLAFLMLLFAVNTMAKRDVTLWTAIRDMGVMYQQGQRDSALAQARHLLVTADAGGDGLAQCVLHNFIGVALDDKGDKHGAAAEYTKCVEISERKGYRQKAAKSQLPIYYQTMLNAYGQLVLYYSEDGRSQQSLWYSREGMEWVRDCKDAATRVPGLIVFADELMEHKEYDLIYEPMKYGVQDATRLGKYDFALRMTAHIIYIERNVMHRDLKNIAWVRIGKNLMGQAKTESAKTAYLMAVRKTPAETSPGAYPGPSEGEELTDNLANADSANEVSPVSHAPEESGKVSGKASIKYVLVHNEWVRVLGMLLAVAVLFLVIYMLWQRRRRKRTALLAEQAKDESYREGQETERGRLARELHDGVSNQLFAVEMKLQQEGASPQTMHLLSESREQVRRVSHELIPPEFEHTTIDEVLSNYCHEINGAGTCDISYTSSPADTDWTIVGKSLSLEIYRIVQEVLSNVLKHSDATDIAVGMHLKEHQLILIISDNGSAPVNDNTSSGIGKQTIRQRTKAIGGTLEVFRHSLGNVVRLTVGTTQAQSD